MSAKYVTPAKDDAEMRAVRAAIIRNGGFIVGSRPKGIVGYEIVWTVDPR